VTATGYHKCIVNTPPSGTAFFYALMSHKLYLDESGDLGWTFDKPFRNGGSSRFLTIAYIIVPSDYIKYCNRVVKNIYDLFKVDPRIELKGTSMNDEQKKIAAGKIIKLMREKPDLILGSITVKKENVKSHIRDDSNKLYNYMIGLCTLHKIKTFPEVEMIRDSRSVKVKSGNSCIDYLNIKLAFDIDSATKLTDNPTESHTELNLIFIDWVANFVWSHYEDNKSDPFNRLLERLNNVELFF
jgi:hypothetical protein